MPATILMARFAASAKEPGRIPEDATGRVGITAGVGDPAGAAVGCGGGAIGSDAEGVPVGAAVGALPATCGIFSVIPTRSRVESVRLFAAIISGYLVPSP